MQAISPALLAGRVRNALTINECGKAVTHAARIRNANQSALAICAGAVEINGTNTSNAAVICQAMALKG